MAGETPGCHGGPYCEVFGVVLGLAVFKFISAAGISVSTQDLVSGQLGVCRTPWFGTGQGLVGDGRSCGFGLTPVSVWLQFEFGGVI